MPSHGIPRIQTLRLPSSLKELSKTWSFLLLLLCTLFNPYRSCPAPLHLFFISLLIDKSISMHLRLPLIYLYCYCYYYLDQTQLAEFRSYEGQDMLYTGDKIVPIKVFLSFFLSCTEYCSLSYCSIWFWLLAIIWKDFALFLRSQLDLRVNNTLIKDQFLWVR